MAWHQVLLLLPSLLLTMMTTTTKMLLTTMLAAVVFAAVTAEWNGLDPRSHLPATGSKPAKLLPPLHSVSV
jgi:hypothetical protein